MASYVLRDEKNNFISLSLDNPRHMTWQWDFLALSRSISMIFGINEWQQPIFKNFNKVHPTALISHYLIEAKISPMDKAFSILSRLSKIDTGKCAIPSKTNIKINSYEDVKKNKQVMQAITFIGSLDAYSQEIVEFNNKILEVKATFDEFLGHIKEKHENTKFKFLKNKQGQVIDWAYLEPLYLFDKNKAQEVQAWAQYIESGGWKKNLLEVNGFKSSFQKIKQVAKFSSIEMAYIVVVCNPQLKTLDFLVARDRFLEASSDASKINYLFLNKKDVSAFIPEDLFYGDKERMFVATYKNGVLAELNYLESEYDTHRTMRDETGKIISYEESRNRLDSEIQALFISEVISEAIPKKMSKQIMAVSEVDIKNKNKI